jgi:hypothetical protein
MEDSICGGRKNGFTHVPNKLRAAKMVLPNRHKLPEKESILIRHDGKALERRTAAAAGNNRIRIAALVVREVAEIRARVGGRQQSKQRTIGIREYDKRLGDADVRLATRVRCAVAAREAARSDSERPRAKDFEADARAPKKTAVGQRDRATGSQRSPSTADSIEGTLDKYQGGLGGGFLEWRLKQFVAVAREQWPAKKSNERKHRSDSRPSERPII